MSRWVRLCSIAEAPAPGAVTEAAVDGFAVCLANVNGELFALDNVCPHRQGPLGQGWLEGELIVCPWHCWMFHIKTGLSAYPTNQQVSSLPVRSENGDVFVEIE